MDQWTAYREDVREATDFVALVEETVGPLPSTPSADGAAMVLCPFHDDRDPSLAVYDDHAYCFGCGWRGGCFDWAMETYGVRFVEARDMLAARAGIPRPNGVAGDELWKRQIERRQERTERRLETLERRQRDTEAQLAELASQAHLVRAYHEQMPIEERAWWWGKGVRDEAIDENRLGWCPRCPTDPDGLPSYTIPVHAADGKTLLNIRHRLAVPHGRKARRGKYRPQLPGLGIQLFNAAALEGARRSRSTLIVEGEIKALVLGQYIELPETVGIFGQNAWKPEWVEEFDGIPFVFVALDPGATDSAWKIAAQFGDRGRVVYLPAKPDDMLTRYGAGPGTLLEAMRQARRVRT